MTELPQREDFGDYGQWPGRAVLDPSGRRLGEVREIYLDDATDRPEWVLVELDEGPRFVPLANAQIDDDSIRVAQASDQVEAAPSLAVQTELTQDEERRLYSHYGLSYSEDASDSVLPELDEDSESPDALAATPPAGDEGDRPRPEAVDPPAESSGGASRPRLRRYVGTPAAAASVDAPEVVAPASDGPSGEPPATEAPPVLPSPGDTSEPEDTGPMVPPRPEPVAPESPGSPRSQPQPPREPEPKGGPLSKVPPPAVAGIAAALATLIFIVLRRRR